MIGRTHGRFWKYFDALPATVQKLGREKYSLWRRDPFHASLKFGERRNGICVVRIGDHHRALGIREGEIVAWFLDWNACSIQSFPFLSTARHLSLSSVNLSRFHTAQADPTAGYDTALAEIRRGRKTSHWIWYIFPQLAGLGRSSMARTYAIRDLAEGCHYLRDPLLRARYEEIAAAVSDQLTRGIALEDLMGSRTDALKLVSSLTLFRAAAQRLAVNDPTFDFLAGRCDSILGQTDVQGYSPCAQTVTRLIW